LRITEMETRAGLGIFFRESENFLSRSLLTHFQSGLRNSEALLSFHLGQEESFLWAVTKSGLRLYRLEPGARIREAVGAFREAVAAGRPDAVEIGRRLYQSLFGQLRRDEQIKPSWLVSIEDSLFGLPFPALVTEKADGRVEYFIEQHSVQIVPGAFGLTAPKPPAGRSVVAVSDPIYNLADPRRERQRWEGWTGSGFLSFAASGASALNRLPGSGTEVETCSREWSPDRPMALLEGGSATRSSFVNSISGEPAVIHLATHVLAGEGRAQAFLAFSLGPDRQPELLATSDVAALRVPGSLVVMTGCSSGAGDAVAGAGLLGLTRAWLVAGANQAVATTWAVRDRGGDLLPSFYKYWKATSPAEALRRSQLDMLRSRTWQAAPGYWASYQLTGGVR
jgi:CHAT domain-containing protein